MLLFPFEAIPKNSKIALYGAGNCGIEFFRQVINSRYCEVVLWVDKRYKFFETSFDKYGCTFPVDSVDKLKEVHDFDYIVIALVDSQLSDEIKEELVAKYHIQEKRIVRTIHEYENDTVYGNYKNEYRISPKESKSSILSVNPQEIIRANELSLMPRYLVARDIKNGIHNEANISLYKRTILSQGDLFTGSNYFSQRNKHNIEDFLEDFKQLYQTINVEGFDKENYIPVVYGNRIVLDGQHRIATSLALEKKLWVKYYPDSSAYGEGFGIDWFYRNGFNTEDIQRILHAYACNQSGCAIFVIFGTVKEQWDFLLNQIMKKCQLVGYVDLDFSGDYVAFENIMRALYSDPLWRNVQIHLKSFLCKIAPLQMRVVLVSNEYNTSSNIYTIVKKTKIILREMLSTNIELETGAVVHASDSFEEFTLLRDLLLSPNNLRNYSWMYERTWRPKFIEALDRLKNWLNEKCIRIEDVVVVGGSVLEIFGLRKSDDIDLAVKSVYRNKIGHGYKKINDCFEICREDSLVGENDIVYKDDMLIEDDNFHFLFYGIKFINLEILRTKKKHDGRKKDNDDVKLIDMFLQYTINFDNKLVLRRQIDRELHLKRYLGW